MKIRSVGAELCDTGGQRDVKKLTVVFRNFVNAAKISTLCLHSVFLSFMWISKQSEVISLHSLSWLVFITLTEGVYWAVRNIPFNIIKFVFVFNPWIRGFDPPILSVWDAWWRKWLWGRIFSKYFSFPLSVLFHQRSIYIATEKLF